MKDRAKFVLSCLLILILAILITSCSKSINPIDKRRLLPGFTERTIVVRKHGTLILRVPAGWKEEIKKPHGDLPPTIIYRPSKGDDFEVLISVIWSPEGDAKFNNDANINKFIKRDRDAMQKRAAESNLVIKKFKKSKGKNGYYVFATDKDPQPGKYVYIIRAGIGVDDFLLSTTVLSKTKDSQAIKKILQILTDAEKAPEENGL